MSLVSVDYDPFGEDPHAPQLVPVDHDPDNPPPGPILVPIDHDPFAVPKPGQTVPPADVGQAARAVPGQVASGVWNSTLGPAYNTMRQGGSFTDQLGATIPNAVSNLAPELKIAGPALGIFAGMGARTADLGALKTAQTMAKAGNMPDDILAATGWFQGVDKQWRFEIPDYAARLKQGFPDTLGAKLEHPELFEAYPDLANAKLGYGSRPGTASYQEADPQLPELAPEEFSLSQKPTTPEALHEVQHAVQARENFARGSSPDLERPAVAAKATKAPPDVVNYLAYQNYKNTAGEVEARNVMDRSTRTPDELADLPPWYTQDVQNQFQRVRGRTGTAASEPEPQMGDESGGDEQQYGGSNLSKKQQRQNFADAYKQGQDDYHAGVTENPYPLGSKEHLVWWDARNSLKSYYEGGGGQQQGQNFAGGLQQFGEDEAARQARAGAQGFTTPAYRGATRPEPSDPGSLFGRPYVSWATDSPELASEYAGGHAPYGSNPRVFVQGRGWSPLQGNVQPQVLNTSNYHVVDAGGRGIDQVRAAALADARLRGKQGVIIKNVYDEPGEGGSSAAGSKLGKPTTVYATFDPATRRSRFANFDPSKLGSRDLLAGLAPFGVLGAASATTSKSQ